MFFDNNTASPREINTPDRYVCVEHGVRASTLVK